MNKVELRDKVMAKVADDISSKAAGNRIVDAVIETIQESVIAGDPVTFVGFGTFKTVKKNARKGRNPHTNEELIIPAKVSPKFVPSKAFKDAVNQ